MLNNYLVDEEFIKKEHGYINSFLKVMDRNRMQGSSLIDNAQNYISLNQLIKLNSELFNSRRSPDVYQPIGTITSTNYAYIYIPDYLGNSETDSPNVERSDKFAFIMLNLIQQLADKNPVGWVFDVRSNTGGIIYAFILSFVLILKDFEVKCLDKHGVEKMKLVYKDNMLFNQYNGREPEIIGILPPIKKLEISNVHVLINGDTASCGELLTYLLKKQHNATIYGSETYGVASWMEYQDIKGFEEWVDDLHIYYPELIFDFTDCDIKLKKNTNNPELATKIVPDVDIIPYEKFAMFG